MNLPLPTSRRLLVLAASATLLVGGVAMAHPGRGGGALGNAPRNAPNTVGFERAGPALRAAAGIPLRGLALGTTVTTTFYDGDPEAGGSELETLSFTYGEDSEVAFAERLAAARRGAAWMRAEIGEQRRVVELPAEVDAPRFAPRRSAMLPAGLETGDTVTMTFYDGDPEAGGSELETLSFTYGEDSAAGFAADAADAAGAATHVVVVSPARTVSLDLDQVGMRLGADRPGFAPGDAHRSGFVPGGPGGVDRPGFAPRGDRSSGPGSTAPRGPGHR